MMPIWLSRQKGVYPHRWCDQPDCKEVDWRQQSHGEVRRPGDRWKSCWRRTNGFALLLQFRRSFHRFLDRREGIRPMSEIEVNVIGAEVALNSTRNVRSYALRRDYMCGHRFALRRRAGQPW